MRLDRPVTAKSDGISLKATNVGFDSAVPMHGTDENTVLVAELELHNLHTKSLVVSLDRITLGVNSGAAQAVSAKFLHPIAAGTGSLPSLIETFEIANPVSLTPGQSQKVWVAFKDVGTAGDHGTYGLSLHVPVDGSEPLVVNLSDPATGGPRWNGVDTPPSLSLTFFSFLVAGGDEDTAGFGFAGLSVAKSLPWFDWSGRVSVSPVIVEGKDSGGGVWTRWQIVLPIPFPQRKTWSIATTNGLDIARMHFDSDIPWPIRVQRWPQGTTWAFPF